jgi:hypothetical protein
MIIEQQQILTTQNLAVLFDGLGLAASLENQLRVLAERCLAWICRRQQVTTNSWHARLIAVKNTAYAWRQMIFFLALMPVPEVQSFLSWAQRHLIDQREDFQVRFNPALQGLVLATDGHALDSELAIQSGVRRFLGWSKETHWLLGL